MANPIKEIQKQIERDELNQAKLATAIGYLQDLRDETYDNEYLCVLNEALLILNKLNQ